MSAKSLVWACLWFLCAVPAFAVTYWIDEPVYALEYFMSDHPAASSAYVPHHGTATAGDTVVDVQRTGGGDFHDYHVVVSRGAVRIALDASEAHQVDRRPGVVTLVSEGAKGERVTVTLTLANGRIARLVACHDGPRRLFGERAHQELEARF